MGQLRRIQRNAEKNKKTQEVPEDHHKLPVGTVLSSPVKGEFLALPLFGWVARRVRVSTPVVVLTCILMRSVDDPTPRGTLKIELPIFEDTEHATVAELERFGWDGRVWPQDPGWLDGDSESEVAVKDLIKQAGLAATFTFPKSIAQKVTVSRAQGPFLMPPVEPTDGPPNESLLQKLRILCENPLVFCPRKNELRPPH